MQIWNKNLAVLSLVLALSTETVSAGLADDTKSGNSSHMLLGGVTHSEELPPLPDQLKTGNVFTESSLLPAPAPAPARAVAPSSMPTAANAVPQTAQPRPQQHPVIPLAQPIRTPTQQIKPPAPAPAYKPSTQLNAKTVKSNAMQSQLAVKQLNAYLKQHARLGNVGTAGLQNLTNRTQMNMRPSPATMNGKTLAASASASASKSAYASQSASSRPTLNAGIKTNVPLRRFRIPPWLAGTWSRIDSTEISRTQLPGNKVLKAAGKTTTRVTDAFGTYRDSQGIIWQVFDPTKTSGSVDRGANIDYHTLSSYDLQATTDQQVVVTLRATHVVVNKLTHKIVMSYQDEEINSFNRINATRLRTDSSTKVFNFKGKPTLLTVANSFENKTAGP